MCKLFVSLSLTALCVVFLAGDASAGPLTGQELGASGNHAGTLSPASAVVGAGTEFSHVFVFPPPTGTIDNLDFDFTGDGLLTIDMVRASGSHTYGGSDTTFFFTFNDKNGTIADFDGFTLLGTSGGVTGLTQSDLAYTADTLTVYVGNTFWPAGSQAQLQIDVVPEPASLALLGLAGAGALAWRRRRDRTSA